jgi:3-mercaptopyruvate sulfurtransferase SseA/sterol desaturase/sphingolipid hydroxylase (fatty acid hydroxylase superfamily)
MLTYPLALGAASIAVAILERLFPWRKDQEQLRRHLWSDVIHLLFNAHFLGLMIAGVAIYQVIPAFDGWLGGAGLIGSFYANLASGWPLWVQAIVATVVLDFVQWLIHNCLHRSSLLWEWHKVHHSVKDGEMDWIVSFRFQWTEVVLYKAILYIPLSLMGFAPEALMFHAVFGTIVGHFNHANLDLGHGPWRYVLNSPRMHLWHHDHDAKGAGVNFGIIFSCWDWIFGTAFMPEHSPRKLGYPGVEDMPNDFFSQSAWQLGAWLPQLRRVPALVFGAGVVVVGMGWWGHLPPAAATNLMGESLAASQPAGSVSAIRVQHASSPEEATAALARFGGDAQIAGFEHPEWMVSARELAEALGSSDLVILDVRPTERFEGGHIPSARSIDRGDYSQGNPAPGVSRDAGELQAMLRERGVGTDTVVVLMGDGGPEPYRLWWTLLTVGGHEARVLDGGLAGWKALGEAVAGGTGQGTSPGDVELPGAPPGEALLWADLEPLLAANPTLGFVDTRSLVEFAGEEKHPKAARAGRIPGAQHLDWTEVLDPEKSTLRAPAALGELFQARGVDMSGPVVTYCQSGTRSSAVYFAMMQVGAGRDQLWNYDGSWAEYSRVVQPVVANQAIAEQPSAI